MSIVMDIFNNRILISAAAAWLTAQVLKTIIHMILNKAFVAERLVGTGGMPSSHSATVCSLATAVALNYGLGGGEFAVAFILAVVVMYDALGVRRETGRQAKVINEMMETFSDMGKPMSVEDKLKEFVGHSPIQVFAGAVLGVFMAYIICNFF